MLLNSLLLCALGAAMTVSVDAEVLSDHGRDQKLPSVTVPECPRKGKVVFDKSVPEGLKFPKTQVDLCYSSETSKISPMLHLTFTAYDEKDFHFDPKQGTNDDIWKYSVMEAFIQRGDDAPQTYLEFEVNPNNVTYQSFIYNPSRVRAPNTPLDHAFISDPFGNEMFAETTLNRRAKTWKSEVQIPLALFNVPERGLQGTCWRMNFFRTITSPETFPDQKLGAWSPPDQPNFHMTPFFGHVIFV
ncbi:uncharacterized protein BDCG_09203 [Blastomyces dermatitidis ER-3]|uniref:Carbohydrate-binding domain-containing protein n=1 Tax=Ajellomyces dermatitidis (strain ER-3 / ATCC MYA-2586) TaxID=559297 RepID=A0ABP2EQN1_AJEDR|nr:uncharacterized protein BDCG_09203 [Blastomyces dermatitidis ER-3]EEQ85934.1 hypothetical protein BDCG_09203 [Blastomyces dermatitidis ER-3]EQL32835.1 hypothetical protein BDFG_05085 [Blastomyces dermatitidis ATCC 26199]